MVSKLVDVAVIRIIIHAWRHASDHEIACARKVDHHCNQCQQKNDTWLQSSIVDT